MLRQIIASRKHASDLDGSVVFRSAKRLIDNAHYEEQVLQMGATRLLFLRRKVPVLSAEKMERSIRTFWPAFRDLLRINIPEAAIIDFEAPFGGGPLGQFAVGIYSSETISQRHQQEINLATGWPAAKSTRDYVNAQYKGFADPEQAYLDDVVIHELGHLYFGFGQTKAPPKRLLDWWFALGLGLVYDRLVWKAQYKKKSSPMIDALIARYSEFRERPDVDQRLVGPNISRDRAQGLSRLQVFGHGKALIVLREMRRRTGDRTFDRIVKEYLSRPVGALITYDDFLAHLPLAHRRALRAMETGFSVR